MDFSLSKNDSYQTVCLFLRTDYPYFLLLPNHLCNKMTLEARCCNCLKTISWSIRNNISTSPLGAEVEVRSEYSTLSIPLFVVLHWVCCCLSKGASTVTKALIFCRSLIQKYIMPDNERKKLLWLKQMLLHDHLLVFWSSCLLQVLNSRKPNVIMPPLPVKCYSWIKWRGPFYY